MHNDTLMLYYAVHTVLHLHRVKLSTNSGYTFSGRTERSCVD